MKSGIDKALAGGLLVLASILTMTGVSAAPAQRALDQAPPFQSTAPSAGARRSISTGVVELIRGAEASLVHDCPVHPVVGPRVIQSRVRHVQFPPVCGVPGRPDCDGRFSLVIEFCVSLNPTPDVLSSGGLQTRHFSGTPTGRVCFDPTGQSDCTGATPAAEVIGESTYRAHGIEITTHTSANGDALREQRRGNADSIPVSVDFEGEHFELPSRLLRSSAEIETSRPDVCGLRGIAEVLNVPFATRPCGLVLITEPVAGT